MIKQTLYISNPAYLKVQSQQLVIQPGSSRSAPPHIRAIEDIGIIVLDHPQITITHNCIKALQSNNAVIISCDSQRMPHSIFLPLEGHSLQSERFRIQSGATLPLKKKLWQQTVVAKIRNQAMVLKYLQKPFKRLEILQRRVQSGDMDNTEAQAAAYYWPVLMGSDFLRDRYGDIPNNALNYGYAILRSMVARALISSGLHLTLGIHHKNKYNAFCLADDIMEPFRPFVDLIVYEMFSNDEIEPFLSKENKRQLLAIGQMDGVFSKRKSPLLVGISHTTSSLFMCYSGKKRKINYPELNIHAYTNDRNKLIVNHPKE